jgi:predicted phosphoribosyltransferase
MVYRDRTEAAEMLAQALLRWRGAKPLVAAIPRGAVPMGTIVAERLDGDLDVVLVRKLHAPGNPEFAVGAIDETGWTYIADYAEATGATREYLEREIAFELATIRARRARYTPTRAPIDAANRAVIVVDDGLATGATMIAALHAMRARAPSRLVCAVPWPRPRPPPGARIAPTRSSACRRHRGSTPSDSSTAGSRRSTTARSWRCSPRRRAGARPARPRQEDRSEPGRPDAVRAAGGPRLRERSRARSACFAPPRNGRSRTASTRSAARHGAGATSRRASFYGEPRRRSTTSSSGRFVPGARRRWRGHRRRPHLATTRDRRSSRAIRCPRAMSRSSRWSASMAWSLWTCNWRPTEPSCCRASSEVVRCSSPLPAARFGAGYRGLA